MRRRLYDFYYHMKGRTVVLLLLAAVAVDHVSGEFAALVLMFTFIAVGCLVLAWFRPSK